MKGELTGERILVWDMTEATEIHEQGWYGKLEKDNLELSLIEAAYLMSKDKLEVIDEKKKKISLKNFMDYALSIDKRFMIRYRVYSDIRERGLPIRTGFKFGCDFRIYERGVKPVKHGPKSAKEHTKWIVFVVSEDYTCSFHELSRAVRLAHNIRANMLWAVVDNDSDVTYYEINFIKP